MFFFDTHCHLAEDCYNDSLLSIINQAKSVGVTHIVNVGYDMKTNLKIIEQYKLSSDFLISSIGIHPNSFYDMNKESLLLIENMIINENISAIGEIGLDYYRDYTSFVKQRDFFREQLKLAKKYKLPVLLHIRNAFEDAYRIIKEIGWFLGTIHCFTGDNVFAWKFLELGFYISFSGIITFPKTDYLHELIVEMPLDRILVETDSPYLSPEPLRGKRNFPWNVIYVVKKISSLRKMSEENISNIVFANSRELFFRST